MLKQSKITRPGIAQAGIAIVCWVTLAGILPTSFGQEANAGIDLAGAYWEARAQFQPMQGLMHIYLRVAGVVWIVAEWIAAIVLIRAYKLIANNFSVEKGESK